SSRKAKRRLARARRRTRIEQNSRSRDSGLFLGLDTDLVSLAVLVLELHHAIDEREDRVVRSHTHIAAGMPLRADLAEHDVAGNDSLAAKLLHAAEFRIRVATVARRTDAFL